jgi:enoyl-[acyl-carrier protein] reductase/trans-2-enoyl-CoA reductase (NAD+)
MGGEDWKMWMDALKAENLLAPGATTAAYSYIGPSLTEAYRKGTIGRAKDDLEATATITDSLAINGAYALQNVLQTQVRYTRNSIFHIIKIMKEQGIHEGCIEQITCRKIIETDEELY